MNGAERLTNVRWLTLLALFFGSSLLLVLTNFNYSDPASARHDALYHHLPGILDYSRLAGPHATYSPNIPGYYVFFGLIRGWVTGSVAGLRFVNLLLTAGLALTISAAVAATFRAPLAPWLVAPFLFSEAIYTRGIWLGTDNPAWWGVLAILLIALRGSFPLRLLAAGGAIVFATVAVRQNQLWIAPFFVCAVLVCAGVSAAIRAAAAMIPACALVAWFAWHWRGLVAPGFRNAHEGFSLAAIPMTFAITGLLGGFYLWTVRSAIPGRAPGKSWFASGMVIGALAGIIARTNYVPWYRGFGIWLAVRATPVLFGRSILMLGLSILGGMVGACFVMLLGSRERWIFGSAALLFIAAQCAHPAEFERYYEPFVLMMLILATAHIAAREQSVSADRHAALGAVALAVIEAAYTAWRMSVPA